MDALEQPFVLCVHVGTWVEKRDHAWSIASVYTGLCPCFLFLFSFLLVSGQPCFMSVPTLRLCIFHAHKTSWMCTAHKLALSVHSAVIQHLNMVCFHHTKAVKLTSWLSLTRPVQHHFLWCWSWCMRVMYSWGMPVPRSFRFWSRKTNRWHLFLDYLHCYPEVDEWVCWFINLMQGKHLGMKISFKLLSKSSTVLACQVWFISLGPKVTGTAQGWVLSFVTTVWQEPHLIYYLPVTVVLLLLVLAVGYLM